MQEAEIHSILSLANSKYIHSVMTVLELLNLEYGLGYLIRLDLSFPIEY